MGCWFEVHTKTSGAPAPSALFAAEESRFADAEQLLSELDGDGLPAEPEPDPRGVKDMSSSAAARAGWRPARQSGHGLSAGGGSRAPRAVFSAPFGGALAAQVKHKKRRKSARGLADHVSRTAVLADHAYSQ